MLLITILVFALIFVQGVHDFLLAEHFDGEYTGWSNLEVVRAFGTVERAMMTLYFSCSGGDDWSRYFDIICRVGSGYGVLFVFFVTFACVAVWNIITSLFLNNALQLGKPDIDTMVMEKHFQNISDARDLTDLIVDELDIGTSGRISRAELKELVKDPKFMAQTEAIGVEIRDIEMFYAMLGSISSSDDVSVDTFVKCCMRLRGYATALDVHTLSFETQALHRSYK